MSGFRDLSIQRKLTAILMLTSTVALVVACASFIVNDLTAMREAKAAQLKTLGLVVGDNCAAAISFLNEQDAATTLQSLRAMPSVSAACVYTTDGARFVRYVNREAGGIEAPPRPRAEGTYYGAGHLSVYEPIRWKGEWVGTIYVQASMQDVSARLRGYAGLAFVIMIVSSVIAFIVSGRLQQLISGPILALAQTAKRVSDEKDYSVRAADHGKDEIGYLIQQFNRMLEQIQGQQTELQAVNARLADSEQKALAANRAKSQFLANMSHELRTPLNAIIGFSEVLVDQTFGELNPRQGRYVNNILTSGRHLLQLINDILDLAKVEAGRLELDYSECNVPEVLRSVETVVKTLATKKGLSITTEAAPDLPQVAADQGKLKQVMYNLLSNAIKFTPDGGSIHVAARVVRELWLNVTVKDSGIGIRPEDQQRVFGEFEQLDASYARQQQGTGLGLALTRKLVEMHGGRIWVSSKGEGMGSTFEFEVPLRREQPSRPDERRTPGADTLEPEAAAGKDVKTVLVVEDDRQASELLRHYLSEAGYNVAQAFDAGEAADMAEQLRPSAITLDVVLQNKDGWDLLNRLKSSPETRDIPVIIVSVTEDRKTGLALGAVEFLVKPVNRDELLAAVRRVRPPAGRRPKTVLVVDDEPQTVELLADVLQAEGYRVLKAYGGREAIDLAVQELPDTVILDLMMPDLTGFDVVQRLRDHPKGAEIPIVIFSAKDITEEDQKRLNSHVRAIVSKSSMDALLRELARAGRSGAPAGTEA